MKNNKKIKIKSSGFTLVELLISVAIFLAAITVSVSVFVGALKNQNKMTEIMSVNNNVSVALEQMARKIRTGYDFDPDIGSASSLSFTNGLTTSEDIRQTTFSLSGGKIVETGSGGSSDLTSSNVIVKNLVFRVSRFGTSLDYFCSPWRITILMEITSKNLEGKIPSTHIQTTVSSRVIPKEIKYTDPSFHNKYLVCKEI